MSVEWSEETGIRIDNEIKALLTKAIKIAGNRLKLAKELKFNNSNVIKTWMGDGNQKGKYIMWSHWLIVRTYLSSHGLLVNPNDPRWLIPSEMRERLVSGVLMQLPPDERELLEQFRLLTEDGKKAALVTLKGLANTFNKDGQPSARSAG